MGALPYLGDAEAAELDKLMNSVGKETTDAAVKSAGGSQSKSSTSETSSLSGKFLKVPDRFELQFVRYDPATEKVSKVTHYRFKPCVCTNVSINYTPDGQYVSLKDAILNLSATSGSTAQILVPAVEISSDFAESKILTQQDIGVGY